MGYLEQGSGISRAQLGPLQGTGRLLFGLHVAGSVLALTAA
jgi:hypothetical protein